MKKRRFVDSAPVTFRAGRGGNGCLSFRREKFVPRGGPNGGDGGDGGNIILQADSQIDSLDFFFYHPINKAPDGEHGKGSDKNGARGKDRILKVPCGTDICNPETREIIASLIKHGEQFLLARGGKGGFGNAHFTSSTRRAPTETTPGEPGEELSVLMELRTIADAGLIGMPNAGKSSLLRALTGARPLIGAYPFTTLHPALGVMPLPNYGSLKLVDVPGLIQGANTGAGLGHAFLRHVERAGFLIYVVDMAGSEGRNPIDDFTTIINELRLHKAELTRRPCLVAANKCDLPEAERNLQAFRRKIKHPTVAVSAQTGEGISELQEKIIALYQSLQQP